MTPDLTEHSSVYAVGFRLDAAIDPGSDIILTCLGFTLGVYTRPPAADCQKLNRLVIYSAGFHVTTPAVDVVFDIALIRLQGKRKILHVGTRIRRICIMIFAFQKSWNKKSSKENDKVSKLVDRSADSKLNLVSILFRIMRKGRTKGICYASQRRAKVRLGKHHSLRYVCMSKHSIS